MEERRESPRTVMNVGCVLSVGDRQVPATLVDLSDTGALFRIAPSAPETVSVDDLGSEAIFTLVVVTPARRYTGEIIRRYLRGGAVHIALRFWDPYEELAPRGVRP